jgi:hypothetical protein
MWLGFIFYILDSVTEVFQATFDAQKSADIVLFGQSCKVDWTGIYVNPHGTSDGFPLTKKIRGTEIWQ